MQPFGGHGLSGTGPKAGGPLYLRRFVRKRPALVRYRPGFRLALPGPVGESNDYALEPRGTILAIATTQAGLETALGAIHATGNRPLVMAPDLAGDPVMATRAADWLSVGDIAGGRVESGDAALRAATAAVAGRDGPLIPVQPIAALNTDLMQREVATATNNAAAGGNASLMTLRDG